MALLEDHSRAIARLPGDDERLRLHLADTLGAWIAGSATSEGRALAGAHQPPLLDEGPLDRIAHAVATTRLTEIDDIHMRSCTTCGSIIVPTSLILAARLGADSALFARSLRAGYETMMRFGVAVDGPAILYRGLWPTYLAAPMGAAAAASVLLQLTRAQSANALAIALAQTSGAPGGPAPGKSVRWLLAGLAARGGVMAALAAREGYAGDTTLLDGDWLRRTHGLEFDGAIFGSDEPILPETSFKPWCAAKQTTAAIDAFRQLLAEGLDPARIARLRVETPGAYRAMISHQPPGRLGRIVNIAWQLAVAAYHPDALLDLERADFSAEAPFAALMQKVEIVADPTLDAFYPARWPAKVVATLDDGSIAERLVTDALGDPEITLDMAAIASKFRRVTEPLLGEAPVRALLEATLRAPTLDPAALHALAAQAVARAAA